MELRLEAILETLLVGALASLVILSFIFFLFGHIWDIPVMRRFFNTLFGEREKEDPASVPTAEDEEAVGASFEQPLAPRRPQEEERGEESPPRFSIVLLYALMYGLGVIAEGASHETRHFDDTDVKRNSFTIVAHGQILSGTATPRLAQFISDYDACQPLLKAAPKKHDPPTLCEQLDTRLIEFFHNAKNAVFQHHEFYDELSAMEGRINFIRSFYVLTWVLIMELGAVVLIASIAEYGHQKHRLAWRRWTHRFFDQGHLREWRQPAINLGAHWVHIAAFHCLLLLLAAFGINYLCKQACDYCEDQFARRVVGYYLALTPEHADGELSPLSDAPADRDLTPRSPYHVLSLPESSDKNSDAHNQRRLEPSAVQILGHSARVIVANDQGGTEPFWLFTLNDDAAALVNPTPIHIYDEGQELLRETTIKAVAVLESSPTNGKTNGDGESECPVIAHGFIGPPAPKTVDSGVKSEHKLVKVFAPAFRKDSGEGMLLSFCLDPDAKIPEIDGISAEPMDSPCGEPGTRASGCTVEGIAWSQSAKGFVVGIRGDQSRIVSFVHSDGDGQGHGQWLRPKAKDTAVSDACLDDELKGITEGGSSLTDLAVTPAGRLYVTTSAPEGSHEKASASHAKSSGDAASQGAGALWLLEAACDSRRGAATCACDKQKPTLLETFVHSPAGVTFDVGSVLVLFNDEVGRKSRQWAPKTFPIGQDESVFAVLPSAENK